MAAIATSTLARSERQLLPARLLAHHNVDEVNSHDCNRQDKAGQTKT